MAIYSDAATRHGTLQDFLHAFHANGRVVILALYGLGNPVGANSAFLRSGDVANGVPYLHPILLHGDFHFPIYASIEYRHPWQLVIDNFRCV